MAVRIDTFKPKPLYGAWLMELAPSRNDPINELGWLWSENKPATAYALARAVKSAEARRAGCRDKFDKQKFNSVALKLRNMLGYRGRLASVDMVNPGSKKKSRRGKALRMWSGRSKFSRDFNTCSICGRPHVGGMTLNSTGGVDKRLCYRNEYGEDPRCKRRNPSRSIRRSAAKKRIHKRYNDMFRRAGKGGWINYKFAKLSRTVKAGQVPFHRMLKKRYPKKRTVSTNPSTGKRRAAARKRVAHKWRRTYRPIGLKSPRRDLWGKSIRMTRLLSRSGADKPHRTSRKNPSAAWTKARKASRRKWLQDRFGYATHRSNPPRSSRTGRFVRRGRK